MVFRQAKWKPIAQILTDKAWDFLCNIAIYFYEENNSNFNLGVLMSTMGKYCKAYPISRLREFSQWTERSENARKEKNKINDVEVEVARQFAESDFLYLQENYVVTDGIFLDKNIIFDNVTDEWKDFKAPVWNAKMIWRWVQ